MTGIFFNARPENIDVDNVFGMFLNFIPFTFAVDKKKNWQTLIKDVFEKEKKILEHGYYPLLKIKETLRMDSIFDIIFNYTDFHSYDILGSLNNRLEGLYHYEEFPFPLAVRFSKIKNKFQMVISCKQEYFTPKEHKDILHLYIDTLRDLLKSCDKGPVL